MAPRRSIPVRLYARASEAVYQALLCIAAIHEPEAVLAACGRTPPVLRRGEAGWHAARRLVDCGLATYTVAGGIALNPVACAAVRLAAGRYAAEPARLLVDLVLVDEEVVGWAAELAARRGPLPVPARLLLGQDAVSAARLARIIAWSQRKLLEAAARRQYYTAARALTDALTVPAPRRSRLLARLVERLTSSSP